MSPAAFLLLNIALAFYCVGAIWAHEVDIFRTWRLLDPDPETFRRVQSTHWKKLPYWVFAPVGLAFVGSVALLWYHPPRAPTWAIVAAIAAQLASHIGTAALWGPWQAKLSTDPLGASSPYLARILSTHWMRTLLITGYGAMLLACAIGAFG